MKVLTACKVVLWLCNMHDSV